MKLSTDLLAWWGAVVSTVVLVWDVIKWRRGGPRLLVRIRPNTIFPDSEKVLVNEDENGGKHYAIKRSIYIEVVNVGGLPTTITRIGSERSLSDGNGTTGYDGMAFSPLFGKNLPYMLLSGDMWGCRVDQDHIMTLPGKGPVQILISASHRGHPIVTKLKP